MAGCIGKKWLAAAMLSAALGASAQTEYSVMAGGGAADVLDSYLSPYSYTGWGARAQLGTQRVRRDSLVQTTLFDVSGTAMDDHVGSIDAYSFGIRYSMAWLKSLGRSATSPAFVHASAPHVFALAAGPEVSARVGGVFVDRSGNNPANAHADIMLDAAAQAAYTFRVWRRVWRTTLQMSVPVVGAAFAMNYGQSYYEAFGLDHYDRNIVFANVLNMPSLRCRLMLDIPVGRYESTLRIGYAGQIDQSRMNNLKYHSYTHDFMVGYSKTLYRR